MNPWKFLYNKIRSKSISLGPGSHSFLKSLSIVTVCFAFSKVFSSIATVVVARYLGPFGFGEAQVVLLISQFLSLFMLYGLHTAIMRYGAAKENPGPVVATGFYLAGLASVLTLIIAWSSRSLLINWLGLSELKFQWAMQLGVLFASYTMFTSIYQALNLFKQRGLVEVAFAALLLPGLAIGHILTKGSYETLLIAYAISYLVCLPPMVWRFRHLLSPRNLYAPETREMLTYGGLALLSNTGYIMTFLIQPLQLQQAQDESQVGLFRLYCAGSVNLATFASGIFYTVFFPKVAVSKDRQGIWRRLSKAWIRGAIPVAFVFACVQVVTIYLSGNKFPLIWTQVALFAIASTLITVTTTYGQILAAQGVRGMRWGLAISLLSGVTNFALSALLIPHFGITGAVTALIINYLLTLVAAFAVKNNTLNHQSV